MKWGSINSQKRKTSAKLLKLQNNNPKTSKAVYSRRDTNSINYTTMIFYNSSTSIPLTKLQVREGLSGLCQNVLLMDRSMTLRMKYTEISFLPTLVS